MPPWARADEAPSPIGAAVTTVTGRGASFSAQNNPAKPPPTMTTSSSPSQDSGERKSCWASSGYSPLTETLLLARMLAGDPGPSHSTLVRLWLSPAVRGTFTFSYHAPPAAGDVAMAGSTSTSSQIMRLSKIFGSDASRRERRTAARTRRAGSPEGIVTLSAMEHSVTSTTRLAALPDPFAQDAEGAEARFPYRVGRHSVRLNPGSHRLLCELAQLRRR